ncbi:hypothetical protein HPB47_003431 [Ixodes persulcatus]|uniref:Uncharacterized protein n=1 Tax=Ixodes persulcatus TaxID=34615 RepID=A0AC60PIJ0_IXOPE|nr:hypothetical protein HPB47_003431 [Ixodes persulcatus]
MQVFPLQDEWYVTYRNYEEDPVFGSGKCLKAKQESPETEDGHPIVLGYKGSKPNCEPDKVTTDVGKTDGNNLDHQGQKSPEPSVREAPQILTFCQADDDHGKDVGVDKQSDILVGRLTSQRAGEDVRESGDSDEDAVFEMKSSQNITRDADEDSITCQPATFALIEDESDDELDDIITLASIVSARTDRNRAPLIYKMVIDTYFDFGDYFGGRQQIFVEKTLLIVLSYLDTRAGMYQSADRFDKTESSIHLCIENVLYFLNGMSAQIITWPDEKGRWRSQAGFPRKTKGKKKPHKTIGTIDGCHAEILRPTESRNSFYNRRKFQSIFLQEFCDDQNRFIDVYIRFPGSVHDARILKESPVFEKRKPSVRVDTC